MVPHATRHLQDGIEIRTLQQWMGHGNIASTVVYLKGVRNADIQNRINKGSFAAFARRFAVVQKTREYADPQNSLGRIDPRLSMARITAAHSLGARPAPQVDRQNPSGNSNVPAEHHCRRNS